MIDHSGRLLAFMLGCAVTWCVCRSLYSEEVYRLRRKCDDLRRNQKSFRW